MNVLNYDQVARMGAARKRPAQRPAWRVHKRQPGERAPRLSIVLLDWSCRERFHTLDWLSRQDLPRDWYELIWVELYSRVPPEALEKADVVMTLQQRGMYHKHKGYNAGLLEARGDVLTICDSDAVFPRDFVSSVLRTFDAMDKSTELAPLVLMHHELRTSQEYPDGLQDAGQLADQQRWQWWPLHPNAGACMSVRKADAIRFGGFDEHASFRGYLCGPYDLGWRLVNAGYPEIWHDTSTVLWHFAHPDPVGTNGLVPSLAAVAENTYPHVDLHALTAVEAFSTGRMLPLVENREIHGLRMAGRVIGTAMEARYADMTGPRGFSRLQRLRLRAGLAADLAGSAVMKHLAGPAARRLARMLPAWARRKAGEWLRGTGRGQGGDPALVGTRGAFNIVRFDRQFYAVPKSLGHVDFFNPQQRGHPQILVGRSRRAVERLARDLSN